MRLHLLSIQSVETVLYAHRLIRDLFQHARQSHSTPAILFMDEVDCLCRQRSSKEEEHTRRIKTELLRQVKCVIKEAVHGNMG